MGWIQFLKIEISIFNIKCAFHLKDCSSSKIVAQYTDNLYYS